MGQLNELEKLLKTINTLQASKYYIPDKYKQTLKIVDKLHYFSKMDNPSNVFKQIDMQTIMEQLRIAQQWMNTDRTRYERFLGMTLKDYERIVELLILGLKMDISGVNQSLSRKNLVKEEEKQYMLKLPFIEFPADGRETIIFFLGIMLGILIATIFLLLGNIFFL